MEEKKHSGSIENPEILPPSSESSAPDVSDKIGSASRSPLASEEKKPALSQRLSEAFRDGVASANPNYEKRPEIKTPPMPRSTPQDSGTGGILDRIIQEGGSAAAAVGDKAASVLDAFVQLVKEAPVLTQKYAEAFREGAATVKAREGRARQDVPTGAKKKEAPSEGKAILDRVLKVGESAAGFVREAVAVVNPGEVIGAGQKVRLCKKRINDLYIEIGSEAANSWSDGLVETEKLDALIDELRKNEEEIFNLQAQLAEVAAARRKGATGSKQTVKKEAAFTPATDKDDSRVKEGILDAKPVEPIDHPAETADLSQTDQPVEHPDHPAQAEDVLQSENHTDVTPDITPDVADVSLSTLPDSESPVSHSLPDEIVDTETAIDEEKSGEADRIKPEEPEVSNEKTGGYPSGARGGGSAGKNKRMR